MKSPQSVASVANILCAICEHPVLPNDLRVHLLAHCADGSFYKILDWPEAQLHFYWPLTPETGTACGEPLAGMLVTRDTDRVTCELCKSALAAQNAS